MTRNTASNAGFVQIPCRVMNGPLIGAALAAFAVMGCSMPLPDGAQSVFSRTYTCPEDRITVTPRPDLIPHTLLKGGEVVAPPPPPPVAADPERMRLWRTLHPPTTSIDDIGDAYEVSGCGERRVYVCAHPQLDGGQGAFSATVEALGRSRRLLVHTAYYAGGDVVTARGGSVASAVVCLPEGHAP